LREFLLCRRLFFIISFDEGRCCNARIECVIGPYFLMSLLFSVDKKRGNIVSHDIGWFCCVYDDNNQLVTHESVDNVVIIVVDCKVGTTTISWKLDIVHQVARLPYQLAKH
jgi:hypothetical protein